MPRPAKSSSQVSERSTKNEILDAYQQLLEKIENGIETSETTKSEQSIVDTAAKETVEKITHDLTSLRLSLNQTISALTEDLSSQAERFATLRKAIAIAQKELEEVQQIKTRAGMLKQMVETQKDEQRRFEEEMTEKQTAWLEEQKNYEEKLKRERAREEDEYGYQKNLKTHRDKDLMEEEKRKWEYGLAEKKTLQAKQEAELEDLRKKAAQFPQEMEKAVKTAVDKALGEERKDEQNRQSFAKQDADAKQQISALKIASLENTVKIQSAEIDEMKRQLEKATQQVKDVAIAVIEGSKKDTDNQNKSALPPQNNK